MEITKEDLLSLFDTLHGRKLNEKKFNEVNQIYVDFANKFKKESKMTEEKKKIEITETGSVISDILWNAKKLPEKERERIFMAITPSYYKNYKERKMTEEKKKTKKEKVYENLYREFPWSADVQDIKKQEYCKDMAEMVADLYKK